MSDREKAANWLIQHLGIKEGSKEHKNKLTAAGYDYSAVQKKVNELLK